MVGEENDGGERKGFRSPAELCRHILKLTMQVKLRIEAVRVVEGARSVLLAKPTHETTSAGRIKARYAFLKKLGRGIKDVTGLGDVAAAVVITQHMIDQTPMDKVICIQEHDICSLLAHAFSQPGADEPPLANLVRAPAHEIGFDGEGRLQQL